jgi:trk system potassium uptake protein TrkA
VPALNLDAIVSKQHLTVNVIGNFVRRTGIAQFNEIPGLDAVIVEFEVKEKSKITKSPLKGIRFPEKSLVGAILKNGSEVVIPTGDTVIQAGDRTVIFCEPENLLAVEKLFL